MTGAALRRLFRLSPPRSAFGFAAAILPEPVRAAAAAKPLAAEAAVGTLPLLAALGIGIVVAVGAVIAFLQMTSKGRGPKAFAEGNEPEEDEYADRYEAPDRQAVTETNPETEDGPPELADYTIPLSRIPADSAAAAAEDEPRLCGVGGEFAGASFRMTGSGLSIGRDPALCHVVFPVEVGEVSRRHCTLSYEEEEKLFLLEDHGSSNGTFLPDGERLQPGKRYQLRSGQRFALSGNTHWFEVRD